MSRAARTLRITKKLIKGLFVLLIIFINLFIIWRVFFSAAVPSEMKNLSPNKALAQAYKQDEDLEGMFRQEQRSVTSGEKNSGYFAVTRATFIPSANQIQIVVRYNNSTLRNTQKDFELGSAPAREGDVYDISLLLVTDLTPDIEKDNFEISEASTKTVRIKPTYIEKTEKSLYNYRLCVFDLGELNLSSVLEDGTLLSVYADIYYSEEIDYGSEAYGTLCLYDYITETIEVKPSSSEQRAIEEWIKKNKTNISK